MKNIFDYLKYYGNKTMDEVIFNEVDSLILALLSYVKLTDIVPCESKNYIYLDEACFQFLNKYSEKDFKNFDWLFPSSFHLMELLKESKRFSRARLYYLVTDVEDKGQFGALTIRFSNKITYLSFEGTDSNIVGWKENFETIYEYPVFSQRKAKEYFDKSLTIFDRNIYVGGHSKGGNLAMYAYMNGKSVYKNKVKQVYNFDGPGFLDDVISSSSYIDLVSKLTMIVPKESVVGMIFGHTKYQVVNSSARAVLQHDAYSWECFGSSFILCELSKKSQKLEDNLKAYLNGMNLAEKKSFVETFFAVFEKANITNIMQLKDFKISMLLVLMKEIKNIPSSTKRNLIAILRMMITGIN